MRSFLFVPGDSQRKFAKARTGEADALILDLEDALSLDNKEAARRQTREMLEGPRGGQRLFVRVNGFDTDMMLDDLAAVMPGAPNGIVLPKCTGAAEVNRLSDILAAFEATFQLPRDGTRIVAVVTETPQAIFGLNGYSAASPRLWGIMWGAEDLAAAIGAVANRHDGVYGEPFRMARNLCLMGAAAGNIVAIDTVCTDIPDLEYVEREALAARRDGFAAKAVIHPRHVDIVNRAFTPSEEEIAWAQRIIAAFRDQPQAGVIKLEGHMVDRPHVRSAEHVLALADSVKPNWHMD